MLPIHRRLLAAVTAVCCSAAAAACSTDDTPAAPATVPTVAALPKPSPVADNRLVIGALLPMTGNDASFGRPLSAAVQLAVDDINAVRGGAATLIIADEGSTASDAAAGVNRLVTQDADVIVGPASSRRAAGAIPAAVENQISLCSPTATGAELSDIPDKGLFLRTIASDDVEMAALAEQIENRGETSIVIATPSDEYGARLAATLTAELDTRGIAVTARIQYDTEAERQDVAAAQVVAADSNVIAFLGTAAGGSTLLGEIRTRVEQKGPTTPRIFVNGAMRDPVVARAAGRGSTFLAAIEGVSPDPNPAGDAFADRLQKSKNNAPFEYAGAAYDCTVLAALAALKVGPDAPQLMAGEMIEASRRGSECGDYRTCAALVAEGRNIDYTGVGKRLDLSPDGEPVEGSYLLFEFDRSGRDRTIASVTAARS